MNGYATFRRADGRVSVGHGGVGPLVDLFPQGDAPSLAECLPDLAALSRRGGEAVEGPVDWLPPVPEARNFCLGHNYVRHIAESGAATPAHPVVFLRLADSFVGHLATIEMPSVSPQLDYECELAVVIGRGGRDIPAAGAMAHVAGYTCAAENTVRDFQTHAPTAFAGKNFFRSGAVGPWITPAEAIPDPHDLRLCTRLNGVLVQDGRTDDMLFAIPEVIAYLSRITPLRPGDTILTGTPPGVGMRRVPPLWLKPGDTLEIEIEGIGVLTNRVAARDGSAVLS